MSKKQALRELVIERLMVAADEIFALIEQAFAVHEEEVRQKWIKPKEPKEGQHKEAGVQIPFVPPEAHLEHTEAEQTQCDSLFLQFSPLKSEENINKQTFLQQDLAQENRERTTREVCGAKEADDSSALPPGHSKNSPSCSDTDDSEDWNTSADKRNQNDAEESDTAKNKDGQKDSSSRKRRKRRKMQHEPNQGDLVIKREREEQLDTCMQIGAITDAVSFEATAQTSANAASMSWISLLTQPMQSTDPVVLMHEMLAKQDILLQQQEQIFSLLSTSQLQIPECSLNYKDLPIRDHQVLMGMEARLQDQDYRTKLINHLGLIGGKDIRDTVFRIMKRVFSNTLAMKTNWRGINGKSPFASLKLKDVIIAAVWKNPLTPTASAHEVEKYIKRWLQLAIDREGGRRRRTKPLD